jgi:hypothetical protein
MRKYAIFVMAILALVVLASGCTSQGNNTYNSSGISFNYSSNWQELPNIKTPNAIVAVGDPNSVNSSTNNVNTLVIIQKVAMPQGTTLKQTYDDIYAQYAKDSSYRAISEKTVTVNGLTAYENIHRINVSGVQKEEKAVWFGKNGNIYVILCGALPSDFDSQRANFDMVINSFKIQ